MTIFASILIILAFCLFIIIRHRAAMRLEDAYKDLERANERAKESSRMKSDFIQQISHEIRTPLNILSGYTQLLTTPGMQYDEETLDEIKQQITENTDRITSLVNKMLELSEAKSMSVIECNDRVRAIQIATEAADASGIRTAPICKQLSEPCRWCLTMHESLLLLLRHAKRENLLTICRRPFCASRFLHLVFSSLSRTRALAFPIRRLNASSKNSCSWTSIIMAQVSA